MNLSLREQEKLMIALAAYVARERKEKGLKLNLPEATAIISNELLEKAREGKMVEELMKYGSKILTKEDVMDGVAEVLTNVQVEATFPDGTKLISVSNPIK